MRESLLIEKKCYRIDEMMLPEVSRLISPEILVEIEADAIIITDAE
jgi:hypothetical protein